MGMYETFYCWKKIYRLMQERGARHVQQGGGQVSLILGGENLAKSLESQYKY